MLTLLNLKTNNLLFPLIRSSLNNVPFHKHTNALTRYVADKFPVHLAIHEISSLNSTPPEYTQMHVHDHEDEVNIIISSEQLQYKIVIADDEHIVRSNTAIFIPKGVAHSANVLGGTGFFVTLRF